MIHDVAAVAQAAAPKPAELIQLGSPTVITHRRGAIVLIDAGYSINAHITVGIRSLTVKGPDFAADWAPLFNAVFSDESCTEGDIPPAFAYGGIVTILRAPWILHGDAALTNAAAAVLPRFVNTKVGGA